MSDSAPPASFLRSRLFRRLLFVGISLSIGYVIQLTVKEYGLRKMGLFCSKNLHNLEAAKKRARRLPNQTTFTGTSELIPYLDHHTVPMCPLGGTYDNVLSLEKKCACTLNGHPSYEPRSTGTDLHSNGYMDYATPKPTPLLTLPNLTFLDDLISFAKAKTNTLTPKPQRLFSNEPDKP